jgi:hypothetical protein
MDIFFLGGGGGIRTLEAREGLAVFKTTGINHYPTPPNSAYLRTCFGLLLPTILKYFTISVNRSIFTLRPLRINARIPSWHRVVATVSRNGREKLTNAILG